VYQHLVRLYVDKQFLKQTLWVACSPRSLHPAPGRLQVIPISPIPGEATGILGGFLFGQWLGLLYSTIGSPWARSYPSPSGGGWAPLRQEPLKEETWQKLGFIVEAEAPLSASSSS